MKDSLRDSKKESTKKNIMRKWSIIGVIVIFLSLFLYSIYVFNMEKFSNEVDTHIYSQNNFAQGSTASMRVVTVDHSTGELLLNSNVKIEVENEQGDKVLLYEGETNAEGTPEINFTFPEYLDGEYELIITTTSSKGKDVLTKPISIERKHKILLSSDKPIYQPSQVIHLRALVTGPSNLKPLSNEEVTFEVEDSKGNKVFKKTIETTEYGIASANFTLADELNLGKYTVRAIVNEENTEKTVEVKKYVLPKFKVGFSTEKTYYLPNEILKGSIDSQYFFGKPVNSADVTIEIYTYEVDMKKIGEITGTTDSSGKYTFEYNLPSYFVGIPLEKGSSLLFFNISVLDNAGHSEEVLQSVPIAQNPIEIELVPESGELEEKLENIIYVVTTYPDGNAAPATVTIDNKTIQTNSFGIGEIRLIPESKYITLDVSAVDSKGNKGSKTFSFPQDYSRTPQNEIELRRNQRYYSYTEDSENILLRVDKSIFEVGDTINVEVFSTRDKGTAYVDVIKNKQTILTKVVDIENSKGTLALDVDNSMSGSLEINVYKILRDTNIVRDSRNVFVNDRNDINIDILKDKETYEPGDEATITFTTTKNDNPIVSAIGVNIVDESIFALSEKYAGFERLYFELEKELMTPRAQIYGLTLPGIIYDKYPVMDESTFAQVSNILLANPESNEVFSLKASSAIEKAEKIEKKKEEQSEFIFSILFYIIVIMPVGMLGFGIYKKYRELKTFFVNILISIGTYTGVGLLIALMIYIILIVDEVAGYKKEELALEILSIVFIITAGVLFYLAYSARKKNRFWSFFIPMIVAIIQMSIVPLLLIESFFKRSGSEETLIIFSLIIGAAVFIYSFISLWKYGNKEVKTETTLLAAYSFFIIGFIFIVNIFDISSRLVEEKVMWIGFSMVLLLFPFGNYVGEMLRERNRLVVSLVVSTSLFIFLSLFSFLIMTMSVGDRTMDLEGGNEKANQIAGARDESVFLGKSDGSNSVSSTADEPRVRQFFPETLYVNPQVITDSNGKATLTIPVADSITSWRVSAIANSKSGEIGSTTGSMIVFQDFFVDIDLPVALTQNDEVSIPIAIYNYLETKQDIRLELKEENWFELNDKPTKTISLSKNEITVLYYKIKVKDIGKQTLTVYAYANSKSDAIIRSIEIVPDGDEIRTAVSDRLEGTIEKSFSIPQEAIENSEKVFVKIYPGIFSQMVEGLDSMLKMPGGCFEQTSSTTYPNILTLDYMKETNQISPEINFKAEEYIGIGYQRLLSFETTTPGGWSWFGPPEGPNMMLSAYGLMEFYDMNKVYEIDENIIDRTQQYLISTQKSDGSFKVEGRLHTQGLNLGNVMDSTCFVGWNLAYTGYDKLSSTKNYIKNNLNLESSESYTLALCANAMAYIDRKDSFTLDILKELDKRAVTDGKMMYWEGSVSPQYKSAVGATGNVISIETTALTALAYMKVDYKTNAINKILNFIVKKKDSYGNWQTTYSTILALKALIYSLGGDNEDSNAIVEIFANGEKIKEVTINEENFDVLQQIDVTNYLKDGENDIKITVDGKGSLFYQIVTSYYLPRNKVEKPIGENKIIDIEVDYDKTQLKVNDIVIANVSAKYNGEGFVNNAMLDLGIPPGFSVDSSDLEQAVKDGKIKKYDMTGRQIIIYLQYLDQEGISLEYKLKAKYPIKAQTPESKVYDYYNPSVEDSEEPVEFIVE